MAGEGLIKFGDYYLIDKIATGGMAEIWRAKTVGLEGFERVVAIKFILQTYTQNPEFSSMFIDEARIASSLNHSNIVRITNFGVIDNRYYHEMEFVDGRNLRQVMHKCRDVGIKFPVDSACFVVSEICKGLHYVHTKHDPITNEPLNIIHRDMSPQNVLISYEGEVKILDWGIAKARGKMEETRAGVLKGKFGYMSPEQAEGEELDPRTDIFSTGILFYEAVTGERLFVADNEVNTLKKIREAAIPLPSKANPEVDKDLEAIIMRTLARHKVERYQTCYDVYEDLVRYFHKKFPSYNSLKLSRFIKELFSSEIVADRKRVNEKEQSMPSYSPMSYRSGRYPQEERTKVSVSQDGDNTGYSQSYAPVSEPEANKSTMETRATEISEFSERAQEPVYEPEEPFYQPPKKKRKTLMTILLTLTIILVAVLYFGGTKKEGTVTKQVAQQQPLQEATVQQPVQEPVQEAKPQPPAEQPQAAEVATKGSLSLSTTPISAEVFVDDESRGKTPITLNDLAIGNRYQLTLKANGFESVSKYFTIRKERNNLVLPLTPLVASGASYLSIDVEPPVNIYVDGRLVSSFKSLYMHPVTPGQHRVEFVNKNMKIDHTVRVDVGKGSHVRRTYTLR